MLAREQDAPHLERFFQRLPGLGEPELADNLDRMGQLELASNNLTAARIDIERGLNIRIHFYGRNNDTVASSLVHLGNVLSAGSAALRYRRLLRRLFRNRGHRAWSRWQARARILCRRVQDRLYRSKSQPGFARSRLLLWNRSRTGGCGCCRPCSEEIGPDRRRLARGRWCQACRRGAPERQAGRRAPWQHVARRGRPDRGHNCCGPAYDRDAKTQRG